MSIFVLRQAPHLSTADFRHIAFSEGPRRCEGLFRAAISAFCTLTRPTRSEVTRLDDLALGLFDAVPAEARRFAAAALSECDPAPMGLVRRLCDEPVETSAPLLVCSRVLSDVDLISLIARHGLPHARAIARRDKLNPVVAALIRALVARAESEAEIAASAVEEPEPDPLEKVRQQLRDLMVQADAEGKVDGAAAFPIPGQDHAYPALRDAALANDTATLVADLSRLLSVSTERARRLAAGITYADLLTGLRALDFDEEQAFLLTAVLYPAQVMHAAAVRLFIARFRAMSAEEAREKVRAWRERDERRSAPAAPQSLASAK